MGRPRKVKKDPVQPFTWSDLGISSTKESQLEAVGLTPMDVTKIVEVVLPDQPTWSPEGPWKGMALTAWVRGYVDLPGLVSLCAVSKDRRAELDLTNITWGSKDPIVELLEGEIHRAQRFRVPLDIGGVRYSIHVDWLEETIEAIRVKDAVSIHLTVWEYEDGDPGEHEGLLGALRELLGPFSSGQYALDEMVEMDDELAAILLQHRARAALEKLSKPHGLQLMLDL